MEVLEGLERYPLEHTVAYIFMHVRKKDRKAQAGYNVTLMSTVLRTLF